MPTLFASAERAPIEELSALYQKLVREPLLQPLLDSFPGPTVILNQYRQAVMVNDKLAALLNKPAHELLGLHPGGMLNCIHWREQPGGCGTTGSCHLCGALRAILNSQQRAAPDVQECRITRTTEEDSAALDLRIWTTPISISGERLTVLTMRDITDEKRRAVLERLFFHDILNTAGGLHGLLEILPNETGSEAIQTMQAARDLAGELLEEVQSARDLAAAERGDLRVEFQPLDAAVLLSQLCASYRHQPVAEGKTIAPPVISGVATIRSSELLLRRVVGNLIKNALEASACGQTVTVSFHNSSQPVFSVHNQSVMTEDVKLQLFQRSFSTKPGHGRGIGTYSVKLLTERYLCGTVDFASPAPEGGTTFSIRLAPESAG